VKDLKQVTKYEQPFVSIIIPAFNEAQRLPPTLARVAEFLRAQPYRSEVLIVENGSTDQTSAVVERFITEQTAAGDPFDLRLLHSDPGKGAAVKQGMLAGRGEFLVISDTDLAVPIEELNNFLPPAVPRKDYAITIASREIPGAVRHGEPAYRHLMGRVFNFLVRVMAVHGIHDTQCGFKCFSRKAAQQVFPLQTIDGWGFDVEVLYIAQRHGLPILEIPVNWYYGDDSRVSPLRDTVNMLSELFRIRRNGRRGLYDELSPVPVADELPAA
jgi:dolichyl-phosphate beta-glucosyltransferase